MKNFLKSTAVMAGLLMLLASSELKAQIVPPNYPIINNTSCSITFYWTMWCSTCSGGSPVSSTIPVTLTPGSMALTATEYLIAGGGSIVPSGTMVEINVTQTNGTSLDLSGTPPPGVSNSVNSSTGTNSATPLLNGSTCPSLNITGAFGGVTFNP